MIGSRYPNFAQSPDNAVARNGVEEIPQVDFAEIFVVTMGMESSNMATSTKMIKVMSEGINSFHSAFYIKPDPLSKIRWNEYWFRV